MAYLKASASESLRAPETYLASTKTATLKRLGEAEAGIAAAEVELPERLFVGNVPFESTEKELREALEARGVTIKNSTFPKNKDTGQGRGFAFIEPATRTALLLALDLDGSLMLRGRRLRINEAHRLEEDHIRSGGTERPAPPLSKRVYIACLPCSFEKSDIRALLSIHDLTPREVFLLTDKKTGRPRGAGFVEMNSLDEAAQVVGALNGTEVQGRKILVRPADPREEKH